MAGGWIGLVGLLFVVVYFLCLWFAVMDDILN
jgi:hypothetical protein